MRANSTSQARRPRSHVDPHVGSPRRAPSYLAGGRRGASRARDLIIGTARTPSGTERAGTVGLYNRYNFAQSAYKATAGLKNRYSLSLWFHTALSLYGSAFFTRYKRLHGQTFRVRITLSTVLFFSFFFFFYFFFIKLGYFGRSAREGEYAA